MNYFVFIDILQNSFTNFVGIMSKKHTLKQMDLYKIIIGVVLSALTGMAFAQDVTYETVDSSFLADIEARMIRAEQEQQVRDVVAEHDRSLLRHEMSFHFDGIGELLRGGIDSWRHKDFYDNECTWHDRGNDWVDYGVAMSPLAVTWGLKLLGVESRSTTRRMITSNAFALGLTAGLSSALKGITDERRPNGEDDNSMPSRHVALAYASATILHREYGHISPWVSIGAYGASTATEFLRLYGNKHWAKDIYVGAGIGIVSTNFAYFIADRIFGEKGINKPHMTLDDVERLLRYNAQPTSVSLVSGIEWGSNHDEDVNYGTTFSAGFQYSQFYDQHFAWDVMVRVSTTSASRNYAVGPQPEGFNLEAYHLDTGFRYSWLLTPAIRFDGKAFAGGRMLTSTETDCKDEMNGECGCGVELNYLDREKYAVGVSCDYVHVFDSRMANRFVVNFCWKVLL